jgi:hypothetical protein
MSSGDMLDGVIRADSAFAGLLTKLREGYETYISYLQDEK